MGKKLHVLKSRVAITLLYSVKQNCVYTVKPQIKVRDLIHRNVVALHDLLCCYPSRFTVTVSFNYTWIAIVILKFAKFWEIPLIEKTKKYEILYIWQWDHDAELSPYLLVNRRNWICGCKSSWDAPISTIIEWNFFKRNSIIFFFLAFYYVILILK